MWHIVVFQDFGLFCWDAWGLAGKMPGASGEAAYVRHGLAARCQLKFCVRCKMLVFRVHCVRQNFYMFSPYHNPDQLRWLDFWLFINGCHAGWWWVCIFPICGWFEWPSSGVVGFYNPNHHDVAAFDFATESGCNQLVVGPTHACGGTLYLLMTYVPDLVWVAVCAAIGYSDHSSLSVVILMAQAVLNLCVSRKVFLIHQINWSTVCDAIQDLPWHNIRLTDNPVELSNKHLSLLVGYYVPTKVIYVCNRDKPWFDNECRCVFHLNQACFWPNHDTWQNGLFIENFYNVE